MTPHPIRNIGRAHLILLITLVSITALAISPTESSSARTDEPSPEFAAVKAAVETAMQQAGVPGAAVGVYAKGEEEYATFGVTALGGEDAITHETRFQNGSITKTYTATAIMRLVEDGKIDLDANARTYLPDLKLADEDVANTVTIRQLLNHTGGWWGDAYIDTGEDDDAVTRFVAEVLPRLPQVAPLAKFVTYNNSAYVILGRIIEVITGEEYDDAIEDLVLDPLDLDDATFDRDDVLDNSYAEGHGEGAEGLEKVTPLFLPRNLDPAGGLWTTIEDELDYARFHLDGSADNEQILEPETIALMQTPATELPGGGSVMLGLPWLVAQAGEATIIQHDGQIFGQSALLTLIPEEQIAVVVLTNSFSGAGVGQAAVNAVLTEYLDTGDTATPQPEASPQPEATPDPFELPPEQAQAYVGRYELPTTTVEIIAGETGLVANFERQDWPGQILPSNLLNLPPAFSLPLVFLAEDVAALGGPEAPAGYLVFLRNDAGEVDWFSFNLRIYPRTE